MDDYAGIGARETPEQVLQRMTVLARGLRDRRWVLRSGGARGADRAWELGSKGRNYISRASDATEEAIELASKFHPKWSACDDITRLLHGRNAIIILGSNLKSPVRFVGCWTEGGKDVGGTGLGIRIAHAHGIKVFNLWDERADDMIKEFATAGSTEAIPPSKVLRFRKRK